MSPVCPGLSLIHSFHRWRHWGCRGPKESYKVSWGQSQGQKPSLLTQYFVPYTKHCSSLICSSLTRNLWTPQGNSNNSSNLCVWTGLDHVQDVSLEIILLLLLEAVGLEATEQRASWLLPQSSAWLGVEEGRNEIPLERRRAGTTDKG